MTERKPIEVNEQRLMQAIAGEVPLLDEQEPQPSENDSTQETEDVESVREEVIVPTKAKRKNSRQIDFDAAFLKEAKIKDRRQMYISGELYDRIAAYLRIISEGKVSMVGYIHNVLTYHIMDFKDTINEIYQNKINKSNPL